MSILFVLVFVLLGVAAVAISFFNERATNRFFAELQVGTIYVPNGGVRGDERA